MKLSVIVPLYNEASTIKQVIRQLDQVKAVDEIVVIDDGSTDDSFTLAKSSKSKKVKVYSHKKNVGKGAAIQTGLQHVSGDYVLIQDADLEYDPDDIPSLIAPILKDKAQVVYGSRFTGPRKNMFFWHMVGNRFLSFVVNILYNTTLSDMETCYKVLPTTLFRELSIQSSDFAIEPEITCKILNRGIFIYETPISYTGRTFEEGKKITWIDGFKALYTIFFWRFLGS